MIIVSLHTSVHIIRIKIVSSLRSNSVHMYTFLTLTLTLTLNTQSGQLYAGDACSRLADVMSIGNDGWLSIATHADSESLRGD